MFSTDFIFRQQENLVDNQKCQAGFRPLCNKIPVYMTGFRQSKQGQYYLCREEKSCKSFSLFDALVSAVVKVVSTAANAKTDVILQPSIQLWY